MTGRKKDRQWHENETMSMNLHRARLKTNNKKKKKPRQNRLVMTAIASGSC